MTVQLKLKKAVQLKLNIVINEIKKIIIKIKLGCVI